MQSPYDVPTLWIASQEKRIADAIAAFVRPFLGSQIQHGLDDSHILALQNREQIHALLDGQDKSVLLNAAFILDLTSSSTAFQFDVRADSPQSLRPAELLLRYPEIYWIFVVERLPDWDASLITPSSQLVRSPTVSEVLRKVGISPTLLQHHFVRIDRLIDLTNCLMRHGAGFRTLFDPTGLRFLTIASSNVDRGDDSPYNQLGLPNINYFTNTPPRLYGISIEDEVNYALLNGYLLYKQGHSTFVITTLSEFKHLSEYSNHHNTPPDSWQVIEDVELSFPDATNNDHRSYALSHGPNQTDIEALAARSTRTTILRNARSRTILTTVHLDPKSTQALLGPRCRALTKPHSGFYDKQLLRRLGKDHHGTRTRHSRFNASIIVSFQFLFFLLIWFEWSIKKAGALLRLVIAYCRPVFGKSTISTTTAKSLTRTHSAPGVNQEVACHILRRCRRSSQAVANAEDAIQCAVLASVAYSLLGKKTQHTALEALSITHEMEVQAECMFIGTSNALDVKLRLEDLEAEAAEITGVGRRDDLRKTWKRNQQRCNALLEICATLRNVYQTHDQREEEGILLRAFRGWQRLAYVSGTEDWIGSPLTYSWLKGFVRGILSLPWAYVNCLIASGFNLMLISMIWIFLFAGAYDAILGRYSLAIEREFTAWQVQNPVSPAEEQSYPTLQFRSQLDDLKLDYFRFWLPQSAATFVGMHQYLQGGLHPGMLSDFVAASSAHSRKRTSASDITKSRYYLDRFRGLLTIWWYLAVSEMALGYIHLASAVTLLLSRFSRR